jgi:hypothetical protein
MDFFTPSGEGVIFFLACTSGREDSPRENAIGGSLWPRWALPLELQPAFAPVQSVSCFALKQVDLCCERDDPSVF